MITGIEAVTFDFGNTLVPFPATPVDEVVRATADRAAEIVGCSADEFTSGWSEERARQFAEDVPEGREADIGLRVVRLLARLRGHPAPVTGERWDDTSISTYAEPREVEIIVDAYADAFVRSTPVPPAIGPMLERLARIYRLAVISNWPLALSIDRFLEAAGWTRNLSAVVVSQRVGVIKPRPGIFQVAASALGVESGPAILHVGDDLGADVEGARQVGWRTAWVRLKPGDSPLPVGPPARDARPDIIVDSIADLEAALGLPGHATGK